MEFLQVGSHGTTLTPLASPRTCDISATGRVSGLPHHRWCRPSSPSPYHLLHLHLRILWTRRPFPPSHPLPPLRLLCAPLVDRGGLMGHPCLRAVRPPGP